MLYLGDGGSDYGLLKDKYPRHLQGDGLSSHAFERGMSRIRDRNVNICVRLSTAGIHKKLFIRFMNYTSRTSILLHHRHTSESKQSSSIAHVLQSKPTALLPFIINFEITSKISRAPWTGDRPIARRVRNDANYLPHYTASHPKTQYSHSLPWNTGIQKSLSMVKPVLKRNIGITNNCL